MKRKIFSVLFALVLVVSFSLVMAVPASAVGTLQNVTADLGTTITGETTDYTIGFTTATATCTIKTVDMAFDAAFDVSGATLGAVTGGSTTFNVGTLSVIGQTVTYTVTTTEDFTSAEALTIQLHGIVNPATGTYVSAVTIMTKTDTPAIIDTGSASVIIAPVPASFKVVTQHAGTEVAGTAFTVTVTALKADGVTTETGYAGDHLISFTSTATDPKIIPAFELVNFTSSPGIGTTSASFVLNVVETGETITATDAALGITGPSSAITVTVESLYGLVITGAPTAAVTAGVPFSADVTVTAEDAYGNTITGDTSTIAWTSTDTEAVLPADHALVLGTWTFSGSGFTLKTAGAKTITATEDVGGTADARAASITVSPAAASKLLAEDGGTIIANGYATSNIYGTVKDAYDNTVTTSSAVITFETSLGEFANGASTYSVAAVHATTGVATGVATAVLSSTDIGTATVKVTSGSLTYHTTAVVLTDPSAPIEVWVDGDYDATHDGGHEFGVDAFAEIELGTNVVAIGGTVNVAPGTYTLSSSIDISTAGVTLQSTGGALVTSIGAGSLTAPLIYIYAADVTVDGFTMGDIPTGYSGVHIVTHAGATVKNNIITVAAGADEIGIIIAHADGATVTGNELGGEGSSEGLCSIYLNNVSDCTLLSNTLNSSINFRAEDGALIEGLAITDNTFTDNGTRPCNGCINIHGAVSGTMSTVRDTLIDGNTLTSRDYAGIRIGSLHPTRLTVVDLTITGNDITNNTFAGIKLYDGVTWGTGNTINNNNISGNAAFGIENQVVEVVIDAENNWWGDASGPFHASTNAAGTGDVVSTYVDYRPWLTSEYGVAAVTTVSLSTGWNLVSLPLYIPPANQAPATLLADVVGNVDIVWGDYDAAATPQWHTYDPDQGVNDLIAMRDGKGYWVDMDAADTLDVSALGTELPVAPAAPPTYGVVVGWNLIGFKSTTPTTASTYLAAIDGQYTMIYGFANGVYSVVQSTDSLEPGYGYWIAVTAVGTIYP